MQLQNAAASFFVPDAAPPAAALSRATHAAVGAHPDDIPIMAHHGILECVGRDDRWFLGITVTDGAGSPRSGGFAAMGDDEMAAMRADEERRAAGIGGYTAAVQLDHASGSVVDPSRRGGVVEDLSRLLGAARPDVVYTHDIADRHDTHVGVALCTIEALRGLPGDLRPGTLYGCAVWRDLDWLVGEHRVLLDVAGRPDLGAALLGVYRSQVDGGKRYDLAVPGRRRAHATFASSDTVDDVEAIDIVMDLSPLMSDDGDPVAFVIERVERLRADITNRLERLRRG